MQPEILAEMLPDRSTLIAMAGLVAFFVCIVFLWIIAFRHHGARMVTTSLHDKTGEDELVVRVVEVPVAGAVDGGPALGGRVMLVAQPGERRTVRQMIERMIDRPIAPPASSAASSEPILVGAGARGIPPGVPSGIPDETPPLDVSEQKTQVLPVAPKFKGLDGVWLIAEVALPETLPRDCWN